MQSSTEGTDAGAVLAALDARRGELFVAAWLRLDAAALAEGPLVGPAVVAPEELSRMLADLPPRTLAVGDGAVRFSSVFDRAGAVLPHPNSELHRVTAIEHCRLTEVLPAGDPDSVRPAYLRLPDAEIAHPSAGKP
jgi:tRNA A37 threonylcarbamoyladenosine modification protein TsaB